MNDDAPSPWPERERTQRLLFAAGAALLVPVALGLSGLVDLGGTVVVGSSAVASALLIYGLLGWGGDWVAATAGDGTGGDGGPEKDGDEPAPDGDGPARDGDGPTRDDEPARDDDEPAADGANAAPDAGGGATGHEDPDRGVRGAPDGAGN